MMVVVRAFRSVKSAGFISVAGVHVPDRLLCVRIVGLAVV